MQQVIEQAWEIRDAINTHTKGEIRDTVEKIIAELDAGFIRIAQKGEGGWEVNQWIKKAILLSFRLNCLLLSI